MPSMHAAVVSSFSEPPRYGEIEVPTPERETHRLVDVLAAGLHPRVRTDAAGRHYTSTGALPMVPGLDGVGRLADGGRVYFVAEDGQPGSMADRAVVDLRRTVPIPDGVDTLTVAAAMNPAMSSWVALRRRVVLQPGQSVLVLGATGNAGSMAVQVARLLGAGRVVGAGRDPVRLDALGAAGADDVVRLTGDPSADATDLADAAADVDVVVDYLWGEPTERAIPAMLTARSDRSRPLDWIQIGAIAGPTIQLPSVALRSAALRLQGSGQGSVSTEGYVAELPSLIDELGAGNLRIAVRRAPLRDVGAIWVEPDEPGTRTVLVP
jgi:NADPH:quinone reductase-like Zn-dependent oxidoreductase